MTRLLSVLLICFGVHTAFGQGGNNYSSLGLGDIATHSGGLYTAMGGTSIAMPSDYGINVVNPALLGRSVTTRLQVGYRFNQHVVRNTDNRLLAQNNGELDGLVAMFSVDTARGFGMSFGILPYSNVAYKVQRSLLSIVNADTVRGFSVQDGTGGSSMLHLGASVKLFHGFHIGVQLNGLFGVLTYTDRVSALGPYFSVQSSKSYDVRGLLVKGGFTWEALPGLMIGGYASTGPNASTYTTHRVTGLGYNSAIYDSTRVDESTSGLPVILGLGLSTPLDHGRLGLDLEVQNFSTVTINQRPDAAYTTGIRLSAGYTHPGKSSGSYWNQIGYHAGFYGLRLPVMFRGSSIYEAAIAGGVSMPLGGNAMVDAGLQVGYRGVDAPGSDLDEVIGRLTVSVSIGEIWFRPFGRD